MPSNSSSNQLSQNTIEDSLNVLYSFFPILIFILGTIICVSFLKFKKTKVYKVERMMISIFSIATTISFLCLFYTEYFHKIYRYLSNQNKTSNLFVIWRTGTAYSLVMFIWILLIEWKAILNIEIQSSMTDYLDSEESKTNTSDSNIINRDQLIPEEAVSIPTIKTRSSSISSRIKNRMNLKEVFSIFSVLLSFAIFILNFVIVIPETENLRNLSKIDEANVFYKHFYLIAMITHSIMSLSSLIYSFYLQKKRNINSY